MSRITIATLRNHVALSNETLADSGSNFVLVERGRNGYQAVDLHWVDQDGKLSTACARNVGCGSSREVINYCRNELDNMIGVIVDNHGCKHRGKTKATRAMAKKVCELSGIDFEAGFYSLQSYQVERLLVWAKLTSYRKPRNANGSTGRYFYAHLANRVNLDK